MEPIEFGEFLRRTGMDKHDLGFERMDRVEKIVSLRKIVKLLLPCAMPRNYLLKILQNIGTLGDPENKVFRNAEFQFLRTDPNGLLVGQTFVSRPKYTALMEGFQHIFAGSTLPRGFSKLTPQIVLGEDADGQMVLANYVPPIFEVHDGNPVIMDGIHRNFIILNAGTTIQSIVIRNIATPFPCRPMPWDKIKVVDIKPERMEDRYFDLRREFFRDLKSVGIDG